MSRLYKQLLLRDPEIKIHILQKIRLGRGLPGSGSRTQGILVSQDLEHGLEERDGLGGHVPFTLWTLQSMGWSTAEEDQSRAL